MTDTAIEVDEFLPHPPAKVWRALTDPVRLARWLMANDFEPVVGHRFTFRTEPVPSQGFDGIIDCSVLEIEPERLLKISWGRVGLDTTVTWRLHPEGTGTRLLLEHAGFAPDDPAQQRVRMILDGGWRSNLWRRLTEELSREQ
ncbi:SRPBCC family protein [Hamadaea tsunoensis]|uniref:SRPBCC family protein n=1 Tax=Hamadaea tsunoensis TaxID=53368 RepID=UPI00041B1A26|nr:SRPBCC domain-containing protein [Hamadaea tsunoensis]